MNIIHFKCPPYPHLIKGGTALYRIGDSHEKRRLKKIFDLIVVKSGQLFIEEAGEKYCVSEGGYLVLEPEKLHQGYKYCEQETLFAWVHFYSYSEYSIHEKTKKIRMSGKRRSAISPECEAVISVPKYGVLDGYKRKQVEKCCDKISSFEVNLYRNQRQEKVSLTGQIEQQQAFLYILSAIGTDAENQGSTNSLAEKVFEYLQINYSAQITIKDVAKELAFHPVHITRSVKDKYGVTPLQLLISIRLEASKHMLQDTSEHIADIGERVGFSSSAYFAKQFKRHTGLTPKEFRAGKSLDGGWK